jgi:DNA mismatch endonuclease, patch repair protein
MMSGIRAKDTKPEMAVRRTAHRLGSRFRLHDRTLPGSPDLVFPRRKLAVFVHGCFWHRHKGCRFAYNPKSNVEFWKGKFQNNIARDKRVRGKLEGMGWRVAIIWECQTADSDSLREELEELLGS